MTRPQVFALSRVAAWILALGVLTSAVLAQKVGQVSNPTPADGATNVSTTTGLSWSAGADARRYDIRFGTSNPPPVIVRNHGSTTYQPGPLTAGVTYYWQVDSRGKGNDVTTGPLWSFTTIAAAPPPAPGPATNPSPISGATDADTSASLTWTAASDATSYDVAFGTTNPPPVVSGGQTATTYTPPSALAHATTYYWQVTAKGIGGSTPGAVWSFTTVAAPPPPAPGAATNPSPTSGAADVETSASLTWTAASGATSYDVAFGTTNPPPVVSGSQTATTYTPASALAHATTYYWQVTAKGTGGSTPGAVWSFTTVAAPPPPAATVDRLRVMSWNVRMGMNLAGSMDVDEQVAIMASSGADIIMLQEVIIWSNADLRVLYETKLEAATGKEWYSVWSPSPRQSSTPEGNFALSTLPITASSTLQMDSAPSDPTWHDTKRSAVQITADVNGVPLTVFGTHLPLDANHRRTQVQTLLSWVANFPAPRLFGGDFNMVANTTEYGLMANAFTDAWPLLAFGDQGFTMDKRDSAGGTPGRIDYWWQETTHTGARVTDMWVIKTVRSDHHAVVIDVHVRVP